jgi:hypothetical protein
MQESQLIFLAGQPRSGTTLLQLLIGRNESIYTNSEPGLLLPLILSMRKGGLTSPYWNDDFCCGAISELIGTMRGGRVAFLKAIRNMVLEVYGSCLEASGKQFYLDKTAWYSNFLREIEEAFPTSKKILIVRNPLAALSSLLVSWFGTSYKNLPEPFYHNIFNAPKAVAEAITRGNWFIVRYESLVTSPKEVIKSICDYLGVKYSDNMIKYGRNLKGMYAGRVDVTKHTEPVTSSLSKWENVLSLPTNFKFSISYIDTMREYLIILGYDPDRMKTTLERNYKTTSIIRRYYLSVKRYITYEILMRISRILPKPLLRPILPVARILWKRLQ